MGEWRLTGGDLKKYPHFDAPLKLEEAIALATDRERVSTHGFYPFLLFTQEWQPFRKKGNKPEKKSRKIRYAARADAYIFSYYRHLLSERYEEQLRERGLSNCVIAYRKIPVGGSERGGKCNIHFAAEAFDAVAQMGNCCAVALDISKFFESIDHAKLKRVWCDLLEVDQLPKDHWAVFKNITRYAEADRDSVYNRLGFSRLRSNTSWEYLRPKREMPMQLCSPEDFRNTYLCP
jgi:hypothetical protein